MKKLDGAGKQRVGVVITTRTTGKATAEEFYNQEAGWYRQQSGIQILDAGPARAAGMYELQFLLPQYKVRVRDVYFTRNGNGYSIALSQATDATAAELAQLDRVRRYMGLPDARALPAQPPAPPPAAARLGAIVFARTMLPDLTPVDRGVKFPAGTNAIHAIFAADDLKADDVIGDVLYLGTKKVLEENKTASQVLGRAPGKHDTIAFNFSYSTGGFPAGVYRLELSLNGKVVQTGTFEILAK
jgi:hypothetical protein